MASELRIVGAHRRLLVAPVAVAQIVDDAPHSSRSIVLFVVVLGVALEARS
jgi:hypothetical protein